MMPSVSTQEEIIDSFHNLYYNGLPGEGHIFQRTSWMGVPCAKCPLDLWIYQEIIAEIKPDLIVETGTYLGGSALFMAHMLDIIGGEGEIISIDVEEQPGRPKHPRISYINGSSSDAALIDELFKDRREYEVCMVVLDSDHTKEHVAMEIRLLSPRVTVGSYLIVEDTNVNGHPTYPEFGPGPFEAVEEFLENNTDFAADYSREKFLMTFNPRGFLKRIKRTN
jgi:cephalosporin hydroxylase